MFSADHAVVNLNLWITDDDALMDPKEDGKATTGGLIVYTATAPEEWSFEDYNNYDSGSKIMKYLNEVKSEKVEIPYKQNRAVIFNSKLFHETMPATFKPGYKNRRINVTLLFGVQHNARRTCGTLGHCKGD